ncbi:HlyD family efflux transporter periplasmic adaptor subunit [Psychrosphaera sp. F3M07]|uniref:efflux RND transporter periplasmic adaptor subunit n=1 Tax=Psychrosphaera sp. F3M07 TaxID=2841560 RepID=UPI001C096DCB|nr:HlyD family efflux transporter periplasmic adaptor subunit [Psychrosphaera sp. F3M07]MBU2916773.1 HlyD family efflux transporter periplasmic adaptor subunit [Psychrosphaera sp. F3M07]
MKLLKLSFITLMLLFLNACAEPELQETVYIVEQKTFSILVPAQGELEAAQAELITSPGRMPMTIAWLAQEFIEVKKGDLVAMFDGEQLTLDSRKEELAMMLLERDLIQTKSQQIQQQSEVLSEKNLVSEEFEFAQNFNIDDIRLYSKLQIIDQMQNTDFLGAKDEFLDWKKLSVDNQSKGAIEVIDIKKQGHLAKYKQHQDALVKLEIRAPYDGLLVYEKNWRGEKPSIGQTVFPGNAIAKIPDLSKMQAKVFVLDKEAIGLAQGQVVTLRLDAFPTEEFDGVVKEVSGFSRTIERGNPTKYFEVIVNVDASSNSKFIPGRKLSASILVDKLESKLTVPLQAIHSDDGVNYVYVKKDGSFQKQVVKTGVKNLYFVEVTQGISVGDAIALSTVEENING